MPFRNLKLQVEHINSHTTPLVRGQRLHCEHVMEYLETPKTPAKMELSPGAGLAGHSNKQKLSTCLEGDHLTRRGCGPEQGASRRLALAECLPAQVWRAESWLGRLSLARPFTLLQVRPPRLVQIDIVPWFPHHAHKATFPYSALSSYLQLGRGCSGTVDSAVSLIIVN